MCLIDVVYNKVMNMRGVSAEGGIITCLQKQWITQPKGCEVKSPEWRNGGCCSMIKGKSRERELRNFWGVIAKHKR